MYKSGSQKQSLLEILTCTRMREAFKKRKLSKIPMKSRWELGKKIKTVALKYLDIVYDIVLLLPYQ